MTITNWIFAKVCYFILFIGNFPAYVVDNWTCEDMSFICFWGASCVCELLGAICFGRDLPVIRFSITIGDGTETRSKIKEEKNVDSC